MQDQLGAIRGETERRNVLLLTDERQSEYIAIISHGGRQARNSKQDSIDLLQHLMWTLISSAPLRFLVAWRVSPGLADSILLPPLPPPLVLPVPQPSARDSHRAT